MNAALWLARRIRPVLPEPSRWLGFASAMALLVSIPLGLAELTSPDEVDRLWWAVALSALWALLWVAVVQRHWLSILLIAGGGFGFVVQVQGRVLPPLAAGWEQAGAAIRRLAAQAALRLGQTLPLHVKVKLPAPTSLQEWTAALDRLRQFSANLRVGWPLDVRDTPDSLLLGTLALLAIWLCAAGIVWLLAEHRPWAALVAALSVIAVSVGLTGEGWAALGLALVGGLLAAASARLDDKLDRWGEGALPYGIKTEWWLWSGVMALLSAAALSGMVTLTDPTFRQSLRDVLTRDRAAPSEVGSMPRPGGEPVPGVWPRQHLLGSGPELSEHPVMTITTLGTGPAHFYWRATSYDNYTGHGWLRRGTRQTVPNGQLGDFDAEHPPDDTILLRQSFHFENTNEQIYTAGTPVRISQPIEVFWLEDGIPDLVTVQSLSPLIGYEALSWVSTATDDDLRAAEGDPPAWVTDNYLRLPDELPERVRALAADLTAEATSTYDQAIALESYLRGYPYSLDLPTPPETGDIVDYFLFDLQQGYCDTFATSMVIMARSVGLPARLAVGYATGSYDAQTSAYHVTLAEAHTWPEIYFPGVGWIPFEPTPARLPIERGTPAVIDDQPEPPPPEQVVAAYEEAAQAAPSTAGSRRLRGGLIGGGLAILLLVVGVFGRWLLTRRRLARLPAPDHVDLLYRRLVRHGARLGVVLSSTQTPAEFRAALLDELAQRQLISRRKRAVQRIKLASRSVEALCAAYARRHYSRHQPEGMDTLIGGWPGLSRALWWVWLFSRPVSTGRTR